MTEELLNTILKLYESEIDENIWFADNLVKENGYNGRQASIIYQSMCSRGNKGPASFQRAVTSSRIFYTLLSSKERSDYEKQQKNETII